jgi:hypothetical protein
VAGIAAFLESKITQPPLVISIEGEWGSGKSSFMRQLRERLALPFRTAQWLSGDQAQQFGDSRTADRSAVSAAAVLRRRRTRNGSGQAGLRRANRARGQPTDRQQLWSHWQ